VASPITGRNGQLKVDQSVGANGSASTVANLTTFDIQQTRDKTEVTSFGDSTKTYIAGLADASGSFSGFWDSAGGLQTVADGVARAFYLYPTTTDTTKYWFGTATFDITVSTSVGGAVEASGSWAAATSVSYVG
jgi:hypothetical protein